MIIEASTVGEMDNKVTAT